MADPTETTTSRTPRDVLADALGEKAGDLLDSAVALFDLAQFLLDDDQRLTKSGALDGVGREQLQARALELLGGPPATDVDEERHGDDDGDGDGDDDDDGDDSDGDNDGDDDNDNDNDNDGDDDDDDDDDDGDEDGP